MYNRAAKAASDENETAGVQLCLLRKEGEEREREGEPQREQESERREGGVKLRQAL